MGSHENQESQWPVSVSTQLLSKTVALSFGIRIGKWLCKDCAAVGMHAEPNSIRCSNQTKAGICSVRAAIPSSFRVQKHTQQLCSFQPRDNSCACRECFSCCVAKGSTPRPIRGSGVCDHARPSVQHLYLLPPKPSHEDFRCDVDVWLGV